MHVFVLGFLFVPTMDFILLTTVLLGLRWE